MQKKICIKYDWNNSIDAIDLATSILNFAKLTQRIGKNYLDDNQEIKVSISTFESWSVDTPMILEIINKVPEIATTAAVVLSMVPLDKTVSVVSDLLNITTFLKWHKPKKVERDPTNNEKVIVKNNNWETNVFYKSTINFYVDSTNYKYIQKFVEPLKDDTGLTWVSLNDENRQSLSKITKEQAETILEREEITQTEVNLVWVVYDMNTDTFNGKIAIWTEKVSIWFKRIYNTPDFTDLVKSLRNRWLIQIQGTAEINTNSAIWCSMYKYIELTAAQIFQNPLFDEEDDTTQ